ncbi:hypothetical protein ACFSBX_16940 [Halobellus rarus]|uniref:Uncharacterized protein n=1 Tax=Halobellus rarus TaxID=1126237 RepID=A0ABD6CS53_9EURY
MSALSSLQKPEYTGDNRCIPCTLVNILISLVFGIAAVSISPILSVGVIVISLVLIYFRGYWIPGTPRLTKKFFPIFVLKWFGKDPDGGSAITSEKDLTFFEDELAGEKDSNRTSGPVLTDETQNKLPNVEEIGFEEFFLTTGVLEICKDSADLCLTSSFRSKWHQEISSIEDIELSGKDVVKALEVDSGSSEVELFEDGEQVILSIEDEISVQWPSYAALRADVTASKAYGEYIPKWSSFELEDRYRLLKGLRMFADICPTSGGATEMQIELVETCCTSHEKVSVRCSQTEEVIFEQHLDV